MHKKYELTNETKSFVGRKLHRILAGCRNFSFDEARDHWGNGPRGGTPLGEESLAIVDFLETLWHMRGEVS